MPFILKIKAAVVHWRRFRKAGGLCHARLTSVLHSATFGLICLSAPLSLAAELANTRLALNTTNTQAYFQAYYGQAANKFQNTANLWDRIRTGLMLEPLDSPLIQTHVDWYAKRPDYLARMLDRSRRYLFHIVEEVEARGMPMEIALLPMIESAFNPQAYSHAKAAGIWQFIPSTGINYGLQQNHWYDGRRDVTAATQAALDYLQKLYNDFNSWELALAAYNCGEGCVSRAIKKNLAQGLPGDYLSLRLPAETRHYVPKLMAIKKLVLEPEYFGVALPDIPNQPYFTQVSLDAGAIDIHSAARLAGLSVEEFTSLNPAFPRKLIKTASKASVLVPVTHAEIFQNNLAYGEWDNWQPVTAKKGMTLAEIAKQLDCAPERITEHNQLHMRQGRLIKDQVILAPINGRNGRVVPELEAASWQEAANDATRAVEITKPAQYYTVKRGGELKLLAKKFGVSVADLKRWNKLKSTRLKPGQRLVVQPAMRITEPQVKQASLVHTKTAKGKPAKSTHYTVKRGDTLYSIANRFDVSVADIKQWNKLRSTNVNVGKKLTIKRS